MCAQLYVQRNAQPDTWVMSGAPTATTVFLSLAATIEYSADPSHPDTLPATTLALLPDGTSTAFDRTADVYVPYVIKGDATLRIIKESLLPTLTSDYAPLARVELHGIKPYQPEPYLASGGLGTGGTPATVTSAASSAGQGKVITEAAGSTDPSGWQTLGFDDSAWSTPVQEPAGVLGSPVAGTQWVSKVAGATHPSGEITLLRHGFTLPAGVPSSGTLQVQADEETTGLWVNGVFLGAGATWFAGIQTIAVPGSALRGGVANVLAIKLDAGLGGLADYEAVTYALSVTYVPPGGVPAPGSPSEGDLLYYHAGAWTDLPVGASGQVLTVVSGDPAWATDSDTAGTVTSVGLTMPGEFSVAGSPVTASGTLAVSKATQAAHAVYAGPASGSAAAPSFRALQGADLPAAAGAGGHIHAHGHFL